MKRALAAILILMVLSRGLALARTIQRNRLADQNEGKRWAADGSAAQISCFFSEDAGLTQDSIPELEYNLLHGLEAASITGASLGLPEAVPLLEDCWSASGKIEISHNGVTVSCGAVGTGGAYFLFHPLRLLAGDYYRPGEIMKDRVMLDEETAWALFGSSDIEGQIIEIGGMPHYVAGVYQRDQDYVTRAAGLDGRCVYVSLETLQTYGSGGFRSEESADLPGAHQVGGGACFHIGVSGVELVGHNIPDGGFLWVFIPRKAAGDDIPVGKHSLKPPVGGTDREHSNIIVGKGSGRHRHALLRGDGDCGAGHSCTDFHRCTPYYNSIRSMDGICKRYT
jgi:hypothetical protein